jgi:copper ion binding protein
MSEDDQKSYSITGMTCEHCVAAVSKSIGELAGVSEVDVDLTSGTVVVHGSVIDDEAIGTAVEAAGYGLHEYA